MPKEYIGFEPQHFGSVEVTWGRSHGHVQLSVAGPIGWRDELLPRAGQRAEQGANPVDPDNALDWHVQLRYRDEVNRLIRTLRKARDQAFGKDE